MHKKSVYCKYSCILIIILAVICLTFSTCIGSPNTDTQSTGREAGTVTGTNQQTSGRSRATQSPLFTGTGGKGIVIAVPAPVMTGVNQSYNWIPQLFQDLITNDLKRFSEMTVLDRSNEALVLAEQQLSASGNYSDDDYIAMGRLTNARQIVAGNILGMSGRYSVSFKITNTETNEIQASFNKQYNIGDIESGLAAKETVQALLAGMDVELTAEGQRQLLTIQERTVTAQVRLAQGMAAEKNNNLVDSLVYFHQSLAADSGMREASQRIQSFAQGSPGASIRERAEWATTQKVKWEKIFNDLTDYVDKNLIIVVYDFSTVSDEFNARTNTVNLTVTPGVKIIPDSTVLTVWKTVIDEWQKIRRLEENKSWVNSVSIKRSNVRPDIRTGLGPSNNGYTPVIEFYDNDKVRIDRFTRYGFLDLQIPGTRRGYPGNEYQSDMQILPQIRYFNDRPFKEVKFRDIKISSITDNLSVKIIGIFLGERYSNPTQLLPARIMSVQEWNEWVRR